MASALDLSDQVEKDPLSEPGSARLNPFDDTSSTSRKKRRTTLSISPERPRAATPASASLDRASSAVEMLDVAASPSNTESTLNDSPGPPDESHPTPSSKVTIALRNTRNDRTPEPSGNHRSSDCNSSSVSDPGRLSGMDDPKPSVEMSSQNRPMTPRSSAGSCVSSSPLSANHEPVVVITDDEDGPYNVVGGLQLDTDGAGHAPRIPRFPLFERPGDTLDDTGDVLSNFIANGREINQTVYQRLTTWFDAVTTYFEQVGFSNALASIDDDRRFWTKLHEVVYRIVTSKSAIESEHEAATELKAQVAVFAVLLAKIDCFALNEHILNRDEGTAPELISSLFFHMLHHVAMYTRQPSRRNSEPDIRASQAKSSNFVLNTLRESADAFQIISQLSRQLASLLKLQGKVTHYLGYLAQILADMVSHASNHIDCADITSTQQELAQQQLADGYELWEVLSEEFDTLTPKNILASNIDRTMLYLQALMDIATRCLRSGHPRAQTALEMHRHRYADLEPQYGADAMAWEWHFKCLSQLMRSSHLQLRVQAVATMCSRLGMLYNMFTDLNEPGVHDLLRHMAGYLLSSGLIDYMLGTSCHQEVIIESANVVAFLVVTKTFLPGHLDQIWQGIISSQDQQVSDAMTQMLSSIIPFFEYPELLAVWHKLQSLPLQGFQKPLREVWCYTISQISTKCPSPILEPEVFDLCLRLLREASVVTCDNQITDLDMQVMSHEKLGELLKRGPDPEAISRLHQSCMEDIAAKSPTVLGSYIGLSISIRPGVVAELRRLHSQHKLVRLIVEELEHAAGAALTASILLGANQPRRDVVRDVLQMIPDALDADLGPRFWNVLVGSQARCQEDRNMGWFLLINIMRSGATNPFLEQVITRYLPDLSAEYFSEGMHSFLRSRIMHLVHDSSDFDFEDEMQVHQSGIDELWRIMLLSVDPNIAKLATQTLVDIYVMSSSIRASSSAQVRQIHSALLSKCLLNLRTAASSLQSSSNKESGHGDGVAAGIAMDVTLREHEQSFTRSLSLLQLFIHAYQTRSPFSVPDIRTLMAEAPDEVDGEPTNLKYQSFSAGVHSQITPLRIGCKNTVGSLLGSLKKETGFNNYQAFFGGRPLRPSQADVCKSLEDLSIHEGLILVIEDLESPEAVRTKGSSSLLQLEMLTHFDELWNYLSIEEPLAKEIYDLLLKLPVPCHVADAFGQHQVSCADVFPPSQPFKSLYAVHAMKEHIESCRPASDQRLPDEEPEHQSFQETLKRCASLIVQALPKFETAHSLTGLQLQLAANLMDALAQVLTDLIKYKASGDVDLRDIGSPSATDLVELLSRAVLFSNTQVSGALALSTFATLCWAGILSDNFWSDAIAEPNLLAAIQRLVLEDRRPGLRNAFRCSLQQKIVAENTIRSGLESEGADERPLANYFFGAMSASLLIAKDIPSQSHQFFDSFSDLLVVLSKSRCEVNYKDLVQNCTNLLLEHTPTEILGQSESDDPIPGGVAAIICHCLDNDKETLVLLKRSFSHLGIALFRTLLFPETSDGTEVNAVVLNSNARASLYSIITSLTLDESVELKSLIKQNLKLLPYSEDDEDEPYIHDLPLQVERSRLIRSSAGYVGLRNLSNTCYLNSLLTQLFMNSDFRKFIMQYPLLDGQDSQQLLFNTQKLFGYMQDSFNRSLDPTTFVQSIKLYGDTPIDVHVQMDVDEFYGLLFDQWEAQMATDSDKGGLRSHYGGHLVQQVKSKECEHVSERLEPFSAIQCDVKGLKTLEASLQAYVDGEALEGDNKYKCSSCDRHVDAVKRACFKDLPNNVIFHLKRFEFNLRTLTRSKINERFTFPELIDMHRYTVDHLSSPETEGKTDVFELVGILIHTGTAESGHYYSLAKERSATGSWVEFNDDTVTAWDPATMASSAFGGPEPRGDGSGLSMDKCYSAYMLFYQRVPRPWTQAAPTLSKAAERPRAGMESRLEQSISLENASLLRRHCLFDPSHQLFIQEVLKQALRPVSIEDLDVASLDYLPNHEPRDIHCHSRNKNPSMAIALAISHLDQIASRNKDTPRAMELLCALIERNVTACTSCAQAALDFTIYRPFIINSLLLRSPLQQVRYFTRRFLLATTKKVRSCRPDAWAWPPTEEEIDERDRRDYQTGVLRLLSSLWKVFPESIRAWDDLFGVFLDFARLGDPEVAQLLGKGYLLKFMRVVMSSEPEGDGPHVPQIFMRLMRILKRRVMPRQTSYVALIALIDYLMGQMQPTLSPLTITDFPQDRFEEATSPFAWTSHEVSLIHYTSQVFSSSVFVERLVDINQAPGPTTSILARIVKLSLEMETQVFATIVERTSLNEFTRTIEPWLTAAEAYLQHASFRPRMDALITHIASQAEAAQGFECSAMLTFFGSVLHLEREDRDDAAHVHQQARAALAIWAPYFVMHRELDAREGAMKVLNDEVFEPRASATQENGDANVEKKISATKDARALGIGCLKHIRDHYIIKGLPISRSAFLTMEQVLRCCSLAFAQDDDAGVTDYKDEEDNTEFQRLYEGIIQESYELLTDDFDDTSEWGGSRSASPMQDYAELSVNALTEMNGVILDE